VEQLGADVTAVVKAPPALRVHPALWGAIGSDGNLALTNYYGNDQWNNLWDQVSPERGVGILVDSTRVPLSREGLPTAGKFQGYFYEVLAPDSVESDCWSASHSVRFVYSGPP
jgi:hypothetical protein